MSEPITAAQAIVAVSRSIGAVGKNKSGPQKQGGFKYRGIEDVMNALHGALIEHGACIVPNVESYEMAPASNGWVRGTIRVRFDIHGPDGSVVSGVAVADGLDNADKAFGKAHSYAYKTFCLQAFCIPTVDLMQDNEAETRYNPVERPQEDVRPQHEVNGWETSEAHNAARTRLMGTLKAMDADARDSVLPDLIRAGVLGKDRRLVTWLTTKQVTDADSILDDMPVPVEETTWDKIQHLRNGLDVDDNETFVRWLADNDEELGDDFRKGGPVDTLEVVLDYLESMVA